MSNTCLHKYVRYDPLIRAYMLTYMHISIMYVCGSTFVHAADICVWQEGTHIYIQEGIHIYIQEGIHMYIHEGTHTRYT